MCAKPKACFRLKLQGKQLGLFDRKTGGVSHWAVCAWGWQPVRNYFSNSYSPGDQGKEALWQPEIGNQGVFLGQERPVFSVCVKILSGRY